MSNARNLGNVGARLQQSQSVGLSAGGNIKAVTFQGSGKLLTDILQLTGGNIVIPVGSTRTYKNLYTAFNSVSAFLFDDDATVTFQLDPEVIYEPQTVDLTHPSGRVMTVSGTVLPFSSIEGNCVLGVSGSNTVALSAEIKLDPTISSIPAVGDYVLIQATSGRTAAFTNFARISADQAFITYSTTSTDILSSFNTHPDILLVSRPNDVLIFTKLGTGAAGASQSNVMRMKDYYNQTTAEGATYTNDKLIRFTTSNNQIRDGATFTVPLSTVSMVGNPASYRGTTFDQGGAGNLQLFFNDIANATNTYLNVGDEIFALGQVRMVTRVLNNSSCFINSRFFNSVSPSTSPGYTAGVKNAPFLIKTNYQRYQGLHRVVAVNAPNNSVTLQIINCEFGNTITGTTNTTNAGNTALPIYGVGSIGRPISTPIDVRNEFRGETTPDFTMPGGQILKSVLNFDQAVIKNDSCILINNDLNMLAGFTVVYNISSTFPRVVNINQGTKQACSVSIGTKSSGIGIWGVGLGVYTGINCIMDYMNLHMSLFNWAYGTYNVRSTVYSDARNISRACGLAGFEGSSTNGLFFSLRGIFVYINTSKGQNILGNVSGYYTDINDNTESGSGISRFYIRAVNASLKEKIHFSHITKITEAYDTGLNYGGQRASRLNLEYCLWVCYNTDNSWTGLFSRSNIIQNCAIIGCGGFYSPHPAQVQIYDSFVTGFSPFLNMYYDGSELTAGKTYSGPNQNNVFYFNDEIITNNGYRYQNFLFEASNAFISNGYLIDAPGAGKNATVIVGGGLKKLNLGLYTGTVPSGPTSGNGFNVTNGSYYEGF